MSHSCKRLERSFKVLNGRLWSSANWGARGEYLDWELLAVMHGNYHGMRFKKRRIEAEIVRGALSDSPLNGDCTQSEVHKCFKKVACHFLTVMGCADAQEEARCFGGRVDAASLSQSAFVECGDVAPARIIDIALTDGSIGIIIPYSKHNNEAVQPSFAHLEIYKFQITQAAIQAHDRALDNREQDKEKQ